MYLWQFHLVWEGEGTCGEYGMKIAVKQLCFVLIRFGSGTFVMNMSWQTTLSCEVNVVKNFRCVV